MAVGDVYEIVDTQVLKGQEVLNTYTYLQFSAIVPVSPTPNIAAALAYEFSQTTLYASILNIQSPEIEHTAIKVRNLFNDSDAYTLVVSDFGTETLADQIQTTFDALAFVEGVDNHAVKPGHKRYAGVPDAAATDGVYTDSAFLGLFATIETELAAPIDAGLIIRTPSWSPIVVKRVRSGVSGAYEYRFPENTGELVFGTILEAVFNALITSQVSRKIGVGV